MEIPDGHFRHILLYYFRKGKNAVQARKKLYDVYGEISLTERQCQNWFARFRSGDFHLKDAPRSGRPTEVDDNKIKAMIKNNQRITTREIADKLNISHTRCIRKVSELRLYLRARALDWPLRGMSVARSPHTNSLNAVVTGRTGLGRAQRVFMTNVIFPFVAFVYS